MEDKNTYSLEELFESLPVSISELARRSNINEVTLARVRDGGIARRDTANKLLLALSKIYERQLTLRNVTGINVQVNRRKEKQEAQQRGELAIA
jgi:predicted transcriptional regulator